MSHPFHLKEENGIGILEFNMADTEVNILTEVNLIALQEELEKISTRDDLKALLITSAKKRIFIAGADINEINKISTQEEAFEAAEKGKKVFQILEDLKIPTIAVINGACLGGGYELALSCKWRVASFSDSVKIGLPEVNLGILPGFGGSIRLPHVLGLTASLPLILAGKIVGSTEALKKKLVDRLYPEETLVSEAIALAERIAAGEEKKRKSKKKLPVRFLEDTPIGRNIVFKQARKNVLKKSKGFYPAPLEIINLIEKTYGKYSVESFKLESEYFAKLGFTEISKNLIKLFFLNEKYKKLNWTETSIEKPNIQKCGVIGAGVMGGGIAHLISHKNIPVRVKDINETALGGALAEARKIYDGSIKRRRMKAPERDRKMSLISVGLNNQGLKNADFIIEAVVENMDIKKKVFEDLDQFASPDTILASNTSSLSVTEMASVCQSPERVIGMHFFNPVNRMPLVEIIRAEQTSDETVEKTVAFSRKLGKTVIVVKDKEGFLVNRLLLPYLNESAYLLEEGLSPKIIDSIVTDFGMPMGPIELVDQVGIDVGYKVAHILEDAFGPRMKVSEVLHTMYDAKLLGKKGGKGFYIYSGKEKEENTSAISTWKKESSVSEEDILKRTLYTMINEAAHVLDEGIVDSAATVDVGMIFGTGFPPFRAGLCRYADSVGLKNIVTDLERFASTVSAERFSVSPYLKRLADENKGFYDE